MVHAHVRQWFGLFPRRKSKPANRWMLRRGVIRVGDQFAELLLTVSSLQAPVKAGTIPNMPHRLFIFKTLEMM